MVIDILLHKRTYLEFFPINIVTLPNLINTFLIFARMYRDASKTQIKINGSSI